MRHVYVVCKPDYGHAPLIAFSDRNEAAEFAKKNERIEGTFEDNLFEVQLVEGDLIEELMLAIERKLAAEGIEIDDIEFAGGRCHG